MLNLLEEISAESQAEATTKREKADAAFAKMVASVVAGKKPTSDERTKVLTAANKTVDDLLTAVNFRLRRIAWAKIVSSGPAIETERAMVAKQIDAAREILNAAEDAFANTISPYRHKIELLDQSAIEASEAARQLLETADNADALARAVDADEEIQRLSRLHNNAMAVINADAQLRGHETYPRPDPAAVPIARADVARLDKELADAVARKEQVTNELLEA